MEHMLERAIILATEAHRGQKDKSGEPYILHPLRVMLSLSAEEERIAAVLHDVIEDCDVTQYDLQREGFSNKVVSAVCAVSKLKGEPWEDYVLRASKNEIGIKVKYADIKDNMIRMHKLDDKTRERLDEKYRYGLKILEASK